MDSSAVRIGRDASIEQVRRTADISHAVTGSAIIASSGAYRVGPALHRTIRVDAAAATGIC